MSDRFTLGYASRLGSSRDRSSNGNGVVRSAAPLPKTYSERLAAWKRQPIDIRLVGRTMWLIRHAADVASWTRRIEFGYYKVRCFVVAHLLGFVRRGECQARRATCMKCQYRYERDGKTYCRGDNGGRGCGCGHWVLSRLDHKVRLQLFRCPVGKFGFGRLARALRIGDS